MRIGGLPQDEVYYQIFISSNLELAVAAIQWFDVLDEKSLAPRLFPKDYWFENSLEAEEVVHSIYAYIGRFATLRRV